MISFDSPLVDIIYSIMPNNTQKDNSCVHDIIQLNSSQLNEYYTINKSQSKRAYEFSFL